MANRYTLSSTTFFTIAEPITPRLVFMRSTFWNVLIGRTPATSRIFTKPP